ncbi:HET-D, partial [Zopfia rhizophila CBS 207.26]
MHLLRWSNTGEFTLTDNLADEEAVPPYAILSHTWGPDADEVTFEDLTNGTGKNKPGYEKIRFCGEQARQDHLQYFWIDTCCINKENKAELSHAINSMFRWYRNATRCYVYLSDVSTPFVTSNRKRKLIEYMPLPVEVSNEMYNLLLWKPDFRKSKWFTRGWTLQELLGPVSVEFFSRERKRLGDKSSLEQLIHEITAIPKRALQGTPLSQFSVKDRFQWIGARETKLEEDRAYSLLGIFDVDISLRYGEGMASAFKRLEKEINKLSTCIQDLRPTDPHDDKKRIEDTKGGLLEDSYRWILENLDFQRWQDDSQSRLLWIKGDPGKGKTMLLCGIINELNKSMAKTNLLSYFFCQATDSRINNATAVLRGLIYLLVNQQPSLVSHIQKKYDHAGKALFEDANAWVALCEIFTNIVQDPRLNSTYMVVDALDECVTGLPELLDFVVQTSSMTSRVKWAVSSRNWPHIEERLEKVGHKVRLSLELNAESISTAVRVFIQHKVGQLAQRKEYDAKMRAAVFDHLSLNANDTFLWVALVCQNLEEISRWKVLAKLKAFPPGLDSLYKRVIQHISSSDDAALCRHILASIAVVYRPITLEELTSLVEGLEDMADDLKSLREIIGLCGSLLTIRERTIYFVHQSAKDFLLQEALDFIFPSGSKEVHYAVFSRSLLAMSNTLRRDMYSLGMLGYPIDRVELPDPDPLVASRYSCIYWVDHLCNLNPSSSAVDLVDLHDGGRINQFLRQKFLYWLEAMSLCKTIPKAVVSMAKLIALVYEQARNSVLLKLVQDACRFIMYHRGTIESAPLQAYVSALAFSPKHSLIRNLFKKEAPNWLIINPPMSDEWSACLQTLEGHSRWVYSVAFSHDSTRLASASVDKTVKIWDASSGECLSTLEGHSDSVYSVAFSHDSTRLASTSDDKTVKIWDASSGECLSTLKGHSDSVYSVAFFYDSTRLASASGDETVKIWDASSGECLSTLEGHSGSVNSVAFSHDSTRLASTSDDKTVKIWDVSSGECLSTLKGHSDSVNLVAFSHDLTRLASASDDEMVKIWDVSSGECLSTLEGHSGSVYSVAFSYNLTRLASASDDKTVKIWDASSGECLST